MRTQASAKWVLSALVLAVVGANAPPVLAITAGTTLLVTALVVSTCVASATPGHGRQHRHHIGHLFARRGGLHGCAGSRCDRCHNLKPQADLLGQTP